MKISVVISVYNEEKMIGECLESIKWADETILVDNQSTDNTVQIAKKYTKKIYSRPNNPMLNVNKNYGFGKTSGDWILSLDGDERITQELKNEIRLTMEQWNNKTMGFWIPRKNIIFGKWIEHTGWYPDYQPRLFRKGKGNFPEKHVHEMVKIQGESAKLKGHILHYNYNSVSQFIRKLDRIYTENETENLIKNGYKFSKLDCFRFPTKEFLNRYFAQEGYKDGLHGLLLSLLMSFYHLVVFAKIWEKRKFTPHSISLKESSKAISQSQKEIRYWINHSRIKEEKNILIKAFLKIKSWID